MATPTYHSMNGMSPKINNVHFHFSDYLKKYYNTNNAFPVPTVFMRNEAVFMIFINYCSEDYNLRVQVSSGFEVEADGGIHTYIFPSKGQKL